MYKGRFIICTHVIFKAKEFIWNIVKTLILKELGILTSEPIFRNCLSQTPLALESFYYIQPINYLVPALWRKIHFSASSSSKKKVNDLTRCRYRLTICKWIVFPSKRRIHSTKVVKWHLISNCSIWWKCPKVFMMFICQIQMAKFTLWFYQILWLTFVSILRNDLCYGCIFFSSKILLIWMNDRGRCVYGFMIGM